MDSSWQVKCGSTFPSSMPAMASSTSQEPRDQELSNPRLLNTSNKLPIEIGSVTISPAGSQVPQSYGALLSDDGNYQNMQNGVDLCSIVSSRAVANSISGSSSVFQNGLPAENISTHGLDLPKTVVHHTDLGNEKIKDFLL
ncbi:hypothetical protein GH714_039579 [Hevea brasiliensis]|uniref:Uncharacterized protein n=1 Tax=Hevea brasiliensis TaxID=3981 RepID=A0A6A6KEK5_HEVBR|nr:hypothetical protein GH714_039579 [Hevea brasiliensis]